MNDKNVATTQPDGTRPRSERFVAYSNGFQWVNLWISLKSLQNFSTFLRVLTNNCLIDRVDYSLLILGIIISIILSILLSVWINFNLKNQPSFSYFAASFATAVGYNDAEILMSTVMLTTMAFIQFVVRFCLGLKFLIFVTNAFARSFLLNKKKSVHSNLLCF